MGICGATDVSRVGAVGSVEVFGALNRLELPVDAPGRLAKGLDGWTDVSCSVARGVGCAGSDSGALDTSWVLFAPNG